MDENNNCTCHITDAQRSSTDILSNSKDTCGMYSLCGVDCAVCHKLKCDLFNCYCKIVFDIDNNVINYVNILGNIPDNNINIYNTKCQLFCKLFHIRVHNESRYGYVKSKKYLRYILLHLYAWEYARTCHQYSNAHLLESYNDEYGKYSEERIHTPIVAWLCTIIGNNNLYSGFFNICGDEDGDLTLHHKETPVDRRLLARIYKREWYDTMFDDSEFFVSLEKYIGARFAKRIGNGKRAINGDFVIFPPCETCRANISDFCTVKSGMNMKKVSYMEGLYAHFLSRTFNECEKIDTPVDNSYRYNHTVTLLIIGDNNENVEKKNEEPKEYNPKGYVYLVAKSDMRDDCLKLGMSDDLTEERLKSYGKERVVYARIVVKKPIKCEKELKKQFNEKFKCIKGSETFKGDRHAMVVEFVKIASEYI